MYKVVVSTYSHDIFTQSIVPGYDEAIEVAKEYRRAIDVTKVVIEYVGDY
jgi:hypothetical protein